MKQLTKYITFLSSSVSNVAKTPRKTTGSQRGVGKAADAKPTNSPNSRDHAAKSHRENTQREPQESLEQAKLRCRLETLFYQREKEAHHKDVFALKQRYEVLVQEVKDHERELEEPPRLYRRLRILEDWSYEQSKSISPRGEGTRRTHGAGARERVFLAVAGDVFNRRKDWLFAG